MVNMGTANLDHWRDDWTAVTLDGRRSAQFEETILITETGYEILTRTSASKKKKNKKKNKKKAANGGAAANGDDDEGDDGDDTPDAGTPAATD